MNENIFERKLPTILAILIVITGVLFTSYLVKKTTNLLSRASPDTNPTNLKIANVTDSSFSVSFITTAQAKAFLNLGDNEDLGSVTYDAQDKDRENQTEHFSHYFNINNLKPNTKYFFTIISGGNTYLQNNQAAFTVTTAAPQIDPQLKNPINLTGSALLPDGSPASSALIYFTLQDGQDLSTLTDSNGNYKIFFSLLKTADLKKVASLSASLANIEINQETLSSKISFSYQTNLSLPPITLGKDYDFTNSASEPGNLPATPESKLKAPQINKTAGGIKITSPQAGQTLIDQKPLITGVALPGKKVIITIRSNEISQTISADSQGIWSFRPDAPLSAGDHTVTISTTDQNGILKTITQKFVVFAQGSQVTETATPAATTTSSSSAASIGQTATASSSGSSSPAATTITSSASSSSSSSSSSVSTSLPAQPAPGALPSPGGTKGLNVLFIGSSLLTILGAFLLF